MNVPMFLLGLVVVIAGVLLVVCLFVLIYYAVKTRER